MTLNVDGCRALACAVVESAVDLVREHRNATEIAWFRDRSLSERWLSLVGLDWQAVTDRLARDGFLTPPPVKPKGKRGRPPHVSMPERTEAHLNAIRTRLLTKLPLSAATACTTRELANSCGTYFKSAQNLLHGLQRQGKASCVVRPLRGGMTALWWRTESSENLRENA